jgi:ATP-dependent DNA ligase
LRSKQSGRWESTKSPSHLTCLQIRRSRSGDWLKIKCVQNDSFAIIGYEPSTALPGGIASRLLGARDRDGYKYVGSVGTGFKHDVGLDHSQAERETEIELHSVGNDFSGKAMAAIEGITVFRGPSSRIVLHILLS